MRSKSMDSLAVLIIACVGYSGPLTAVAAESGSIVVRVSDEAVPLVVEQGSGVCDRAMDSDCRTGCPRNIAPWARWSVTPKYQGCYLGGDTAWFGSGRSSPDGTWGLDFVGGMFRRRVWLNWSHGRRYQGGAGAYKADGPHFLKSLTEHR